MDGWMNVNMVMWTLICNIFHKQLPTCKFSFLWILPPTWLPSFQVNLLSKYDLRCRFHANDFNVPWMLLEEWYVLLGLLFVSIFSLREEVVAHFEYRNCDSLLCVINWMIALWIGIESNHQVVSHHFPHHHLPCSHNIPMSLSSPFICKQPKQTDKYASKSTC